MAAENLFLRKQLALFEDRDKKAAPTTAADRFVFSKLARLFNWRGSLVIVKPATRRWADIVKAREVTGDNIPYLNSDGIRPWLGLG